MEKNRLAALERKRKSLNRRNQLGAKAVGMENEDKASISGTFMHFY